MKSEAPPKSTQENEKYIRMREPFPRRATPSEINGDLSTKLRLDSQEPDTSEVKAQALQMANFENQLVIDMGLLSGDPYKWVLYSFDWGKGELQDHKGPDAWQKEKLEQIRDGLLTVDQAIQIAVASGHGVGKSAFVAWLILWSISTFEDARGLVTANTGTQLMTKTWPELAKWYRLFIAKHWFVFTATSIFSAQPEHEKTWRIDMITWSENNTEAFAGMHNQGKRVILLFDEASAIADKIWEVAEGAMSDKNTQIIWACFGNPTLNSGRFFDCFNKYRHRWNSSHVDSRTCRVSNKEQINKWKEDYEEDSDWFRVRVRGEFPNASDHQFISRSDVDAARGRFLRKDQYDFAPKILCLDNAWTGGDEIVIGMRQGLFSKICATFRKNDNDMVIAGHLARIEDEEKADGVLIDLGYGSGVYSAGKQMGRNWILIPFGGSSPDPGFVNMRAFMWNLLKQWLKSGGQIPNDPILCDELVGPEMYVVATGKNAGKQFLESKDDMRARGVTSPNRADQLALSFALPILRKGASNKIEFANTGHVYDPLGPNGYHPV